jgi:hypothetical protein
MHPIDEEPDRQAEHLDRFKEKLAATAGLPGLPAAESGTKALLSRFERAKIVTGEA